MAQFNGVDTMKKPLVIAALALSSMFSLLAPGCQNDVAVPDQPNRGFKGESCEQRDDCASGLACVNRVCVAGSISVRPTEKECVAECAADLDCCPAPNPDQCEQLML